MNAASRDHIEVVVPGGAELGEGPVWEPVAQRLVWLDIDRYQVHHYDPATGRDAVRDHGEPVTALVPSGTGPTVAALGRRVVLLDDGGARELAVLPTGDRGNDGKCDPYGRYLVGTLEAQRRPGACGLYRLEGPGRLSVVVDAVTLSNGLDWSPAGDLLYFVDTPTLRVDVFDYAPDGSVSGRRTFADLADATGRPDGLTVDAEGGVWVALVRGGQVRRYLPDGTLDRTVELPTPKVTSCAFGGPGLDELYVTSASFELTQAERDADPLAGALFRLRPGVVGKPAHTFDPATLSAPA